MNFKHIFILFIVVILSSVIALFIRNRIESNYKAELRFDVLKYDFDTLTNEFDSEYYFVYQNIGNKPMRIIDIKTSCGCTIPYWNPGELAPFEKDSFKVTYNYEIKGYFMKEIMVYSNSETSPDRLEILGYVPFE